MSASTMTSRRTIQFIQRHKYPTLHLHPYGCHELRQTPRISETRTLSVGAFIKERHQTHCTGSIVENRRLSRLCLNVLRQTDNFFRHVPRLDLRAAQLLCNSETLLSLSFWRRAWQGLPVRPRPKYCESAPIQTTFPTPTVLVKVSKTRLRWPWPRRSARPWNTPRQAIADAGASRSSWPPRSTQISATW